VSRSKVIKIGADPGLHTGLAIWCEGQLLKTMTVNAPSKSSTTKAKGRVVLNDSQRIIALQDKLKAVFLELSKDAVIAEIAIETFGNHNSPYGAKAMILCGQARAALSLAARQYCPKVTDINKGRRKKLEADLFARHYGVGMEKVKEHERDAVHISIIAGFDKGGR
jgi:hypothetical protein